MCTPTIPIPPDPSLAPPRQVHQELAEKKKKETKGKAEWEGKHPWKVWSRSTNPNPNPNPDRNWNRNRNPNANPDSNPNSWKPWDREKDLEVRLGKSQKDVLNDKIMGKMSDRFGGGKRETSFI